MFVSDSRKPVLDVFAADGTWRGGAQPPVWFMRQAGRYLPEYRAMRAEAGGFLNLCLNPAAAAEITLQPIHRFGFDAAILFSDILIVPMALGQSLWFETGEGPRLDPPLTAGWIDGLKLQPEQLAPIYATVHHVRQQIDASLVLKPTTLIGFAGSAWTVATYMIAGQGSPDQAAALALLNRDPVAMAALLQRIVDVTIEYLVQQVRAGADMLMLFDSWAGVVPAAQRDAMILGPTRQIVDGVRAQVSRHVPILGFARGGAAWAADYAAATGVEAVGLEETADLEAVVASVPAHIVLQGNLDPALLLAGGDAMVAEIRRIKAVMQGRRHIFNLGHGIGQLTPLAHVAHALDIIRER